MTDEEIATCVADRLLGRIPKDVTNYWWGKIDAPGRCRASKRSNPNNEYPRGKNHHCIRPKGHLGDHISLRTKTLREIGLRWKDTKKMTEKEIASCVADRLLGRFPQNALGWKAKYKFLGHPKLCQARCPEHIRSGWVCTRPKGHPHNHAAVDSDDGRPIEWKNNDG